MKVYSHLGISGLIGLVLAMLLSCNSDLQQQLKSKPDAFGNMNEVVVISDDALWDGLVGDTIREYFEAIYPLMPQPEPLFDLRHFTHQETQINLSRREFRSYLILADLADEDSPTTQMVYADMGEEKIRRFQELKTVPSIQVAKNRWANNQLIIYVLGIGREDLIKQISDNYSAIASRIQEHDKRQIEARTFIEGEQMGISARLRDQYHIDLRIPEGYKEAKVEDDFTWLRKDMEDVTYNLFFYSVPYKEEDQLTSRYVRELRDRFGKEYVSGSTPGSYMVVNDEDLPLFDYVIDLDGHYAIELRGIWELTQDFVGGPFFSWLVYNESHAKLLYIDAFVLAPGEFKRNYMQQLEYIVKNGKMVVDQ